MPVEQYTAKFEMAKEQLTALGYDAVTPLEFEHNHGRTWAEYMLEDLAELNKCDAICLLPCWKYSLGATTEFSFAKGAGKPVYKYEEILAASKLRKS